MLLQFSVNNFLSFRDTATFSMLAGKRRAKDKRLDETATFSLNDEIKLLKCAAIYGANASGKSNLLTALKFMKRFVLNSSKESQADEKIDVKPFRLLVGNESKPSEFEIIFAIEHDLYQYSFSATSTEIESENLLRVRGEKSVDLFSRNKKLITISKDFPEGRKLESKTRQNALFLSVCANFDGEISKSVLRWFRSVSVISGLEDAGLLGYTKECLATNKSTKISALLKGFDLGINGISLGDEKMVTAPKNAPDIFKDFIAHVQSIAKGTTNRAINSHHALFNIDGEEQGEVIFDLDSDESAGTQKLVALSGPLIDTLEKSKILVVDEFDARLHPAISKKIIEIFNSNDINSRNAQMIVATHDTNLLNKDLMRRDQIWFVEKDAFGSSHLRSLTQYKPRNDASFEKDYELGKYGGVPLFGNLRSIFNINAINADDGFDAYKFVE